MTKMYQSGASSQSIRSDCVVSYTPASRGSLKIDITSKVEALYGPAISAQAKETMRVLGVDHGALEIRDFGALPFVIQARIEAAVKLAHPDLAATAPPPMASVKRPLSNRDRVRRSRLYLPGVQPKMMVNAAIHGADGIILDLEDSVAPGEKLSARIIVRNALRVLDFGGSERMVRINQGDLGLEDIAAIVPEPVQLILAPKVESAGQIQTIQARIDEVSSAGGRQEPVYLMPILESAKGILNAAEIATASPHIVALAIGLEDYTADIGVQRTAEGSESYFARSMVVNAAIAAGVQPISTVYSDVADPEGLAAAARDARAMGFTGMGAIHPSQIKIIHEAFAPEAAEIEQAQKIVRAFDEAQAQGLGVVSLGSKMIDPPVVKRAQHTIDLALDAGLLAKNWKKAQ